MLTFRFLEKLIFTIFTNVFIVFMEKRNYFHHCVSSEVCSNSWYWFFPRPNIVFFKWMGWSENRRDSRKPFAELQSTLCINLLSLILFLENSCCFHFLDPYLDLPILGTVPNLSSFPFHCSRM